MTKRKYIIHGWLYMLLLQWIIGWVWFFIIYKNYDNLTKSESIKENYKPTVTINNNHSVANVNTWDNNTSWEINYTGLLWTFQINHKKIWSSYYQKDINYREIKLNPAVHDAIDILTQQSASLTRDKKTVNYSIKEAQNDNFLQTINDLNFLTKYTKNSLLNNPNYNPRSKLDQALQDNNPKNIVQYLQWLESIFTKEFFSRNEKTWWDNALLKSDKFAYIYNQLHVDTDNKYRDHINLAANIFNLNPNLIKSCIFVEQLRAFYTFKWLFKSVAQTNTYLTIMSKQSFWIGGMKLETAERLEKRLYINKPELYKKYFSYDNQNNISQQRLARLMDSKTYYYQILYTAWVLYEYISGRQQAWYNLKNQPWLIATMYNIWYSEPHSNADIWWSFMNIEWEKYSFWWLSMLIYYYLEIYG
jgi:hypothetical protein